MTALPKIGLTDNEQAIWVFLSALLMALGAVTIPSGIPQAHVIATIFIILGAVGLALKEAIGSSGPTTDINALMNAFTASLVAQMPTILQQIKNAQSQTPKPS